MSKIENMFNWCLNKGERGNDHKGIRKISPAPEESENHIEKARHNLKAVDHNIDEFPDWSVSAAFYAMYHSLLAILFKLGYESRNQECTINAIEQFINKNMIELDRKYIEIIRRTSHMMPTDAKSLREEFQYGTNVSVDREVLEDLRKKAIEFVEAVQISLEKLR